MKKIETPNDTSRSKKDGFPWMLFSLGAFLGAFVSLILSRSNRIKTAVRQTQLPSQPGLGSALNSRDIASPAPALSPGHSGVDMRVPYAGSRAEMPVATPEVGYPVHKARGFSPPAVVSPAVPVPGVLIKSSQPVVASVAPVDAPAGKRWTAPTRYIMGVFLFFSALFVLYIGRSAIPLVVAGALLAVFVDPLIQYLMRRFRMKKAMAVGLTYLLVVAVLVIVPLLAIPSLVNAFNFVTEIDAELVVQRISQGLQSVSTALQATPALAAFFKPILDSLIAALNDFAATAQSGAPVLNLSFAELSSQFGRALGIVTRFLGPTFSALASLFFTLFLSLQMTLTADQMRNWYADLIPPGYGPELTWLIAKIRQTWTGFLRGQMSLMLIIGLITWLGGLILGLPQALLLGVVAGVFELIPSVGPVLAAIPAVILALFFGSTHFAINNLVFALLVIGFYVVVQLLENQFLVPNIMGDAVDLPPLVVLIGTLAGAGAYGILGALLATPVIATGNLIFRYVYRKILEDQPVAPAFEEQPGIMDKVRDFVSRLRQQAARRRQTTSDLANVTVQPGQKVK